MRRPSANTVDAALWYIEAWRGYVATTDDEAALTRAFPVLAEIVEQHQRGTRFGIAVDPGDGLLRAGEPGVQLTWMDARVGDRVITPRIGKPVEINALWYNALVAMAGFADRLGKPADSLPHGGRTGAFGVPALRHAGSHWPLRCDRRARRRRRSHAAQSNLRGQPAGVAARWRYAARRVLDRCGAALLTSYGLRSLAPGSSPGYRGYYRGGVSDRDGSYHQGPVWAWLLGHWALAHYRVHGDPAAAQAWLEPIADHLCDAALGQVSEIFDGDAPHTPRGCPAQAWSVACVLEAWWRLEQAKRSD